MENKLSIYLRRNIKEILIEYPSIAFILSDAGIGCSTCSMGSCPLGEIVNVHGLSAEQEKGLLTKIIAVLFPGETVQIPFVQRKNEIKKNLCPPIRKMMEEHKFILKLLDFVPRIIQRISKNDIDKKLIVKCVEFIKEYADAYHHAKEETILFSFFNSSDDIIESFIKEHIAGREFVGDILAGLKSNNNELVISNLEFYCGLLKEHITKEDTILYPWMNRTLTDTQIGILFSKCAKIDNEYRDKASEMESFVESLQ
jgi:hemerythrin-like domain-containing protein